MPTNVKCIECGSEQSVIPARASTFKFCSIPCKGAWQSKHRTGESHPRWTGGSRERVCEHCQQPFTPRPKQPITTFKRQKFCSKKCSDEGAFRWGGEQHYNWNGSPRRGQRPSQQKSWAAKVLSRDKATCQECGATGVELHAHHIKPHKEFPALRWDVSNGLTLCWRCHYALHHTATDENGVNSGKPAAGHAGGNPEPSLGGNVEEGVTTRGRAYRRWFGQCHECSKPLSKQLSDVTGKSAVFCNRACRGKWTSRMRAGKFPTERYGSNSSTSALPETDDIV